MNDGDIGSETGTAVPVDLNRLTEPGEYLDSGHPSVIAFAREHGGGRGGAMETARALYKAVRDRIRYNPYQDFSDPGVYRASSVIERAEGYCVGKAAVLAAAARSLGIPARIGFADVRNHLATEKLLALLKTDVFVYHGYADLFLEERWVKATPAFNIELCERFGVEPLEFDGRQDAILQAYDGQGNIYMEYLGFHGSFDDVPLDMVVSRMRKTYPALFDGDVKDATASRFMEEGSG